MNLWADNKFGNRIMGTYGHDGMITIQSGRSTHKIRLTECDIERHGPVPPFETQDIILLFRYAYAVVLRCAVQVPYSVARSLLPKLGKLPYPAP
ncbi:uncharacterized protein BJX67DRAFT_335256 [Aspergillus lucknowensis]|uniref:Uncharacterized protein n=1 Tax=Aspergillus lucknowensis TaxID=176173 RepID=A0ABR4L718_9EURO